MKKILVTGATGSLSTAVAKWLQQKNKYLVQQISVRGDEWERQSFSGVHSIVHIAGVTPQNVISEEDYSEINTVLTKRLAEKAKQDGVTQFIYISSMAVYGLEQQMDVVKGTITAETPCNPITLYGESKLQAEHSLDKLRNDDFAVSVIRVPSIYGKKKTEYLDQYKYLAEKLPFIPIAFANRYKSALFVDNLCEVIALAISNAHSGLICPDDGELSAVDFCKAVYPDKRMMRLPGRVMEILLKNNERIQDYYGAICYSKELSDVFEGKYRVVPFFEAVRKSYE